MLAFRKEWLADLEAQLGEARLPRSKFYLARLAREGIIEIVNGPARTERLRRQYHLTVEDRLAEIVADDLEEDREGELAPTLAIPLTKMWDRATRQAPNAPAFTIDLYRQLKRDGLLLKHFLGEQLDASTGTPGTQKSWIPGWPSTCSRIASLPLGTGGAPDGGRAGGGRDPYGHRKDILSDFLQQSQDRYLLVGQRSREDDGPEIAVTRLAHETPGAARATAFQGLR